VFVESKKEGDFKMFKRTFLLALCALCLSEDLIESDTFFEESERDSESSEGRLSFVTNSAFDWLRNIGFVNYNSIGWYVTFPNDASYSNLNVSSTTNAFPLIYTLAGAGLIAYVSAYLFSQIPLPDLSRSDDNFDLGFGLQRDLSNYEDEYFPESYEEVFEYEYPDSFYKAAASEVSERKVLKPVSKKKYKKKPMKKFKDRLQKRFGPVPEEKNAPQEGFFESIAKSVMSLFNPKLKRSYETTNGGGWIKNWIDRYDNYWKQKRMLPRRRSMRKQAKSLDDDSKIIGPQMPHESERKGEPGNEFYKDRITEAYSNYYNQ